jgi:hypothetical protein
MEPAINSDLSSSVDLTRQAFQDIGWTPQPAGVGPQPAPTVDLRGNSPNPFTFATDIHFDVVQTGTADLSIFDVNGRLVRRLMDGFVTAGPHAVTWDGVDDAGHRLAPGVYTYRLRLGGFSGAKHMVLLR